MTEPIQMKPKIVRWGKCCGGTIGKDGLPIIKGRRAGSGRRENRGPTGRALRRRPDGRDIGRRKTYANRKLNRIGRQASWAQQRQQQKTSRRSQELGTTRSG